MYFHVKSKIHPYWLALQVSTFCCPMGCCELPFPLAACCRPCLCPTAMGPPCHHSFLSFMFNSWTPTLVQCLGLLFRLLFLTVHRIVFVTSSITFFMFRLPCQSWFQYYVPYPFTCFLSYSSAIGIACFPESTITSITLQIMEKGQMEDISTRISLIFLHIGVKEKL